MTRLLWAIFLSAVLHGCFAPTGKHPGKPLIDMAFDGSVVNTGLTATAFQGDSLVSYYYQETDTALDLSFAAPHRKPLVVHFSDRFSLNDYNGFTVSIWVQKDKGDPEEYTVLSQQTMFNGFQVGWQLSTSKNGAWSWSLKDTLNVWNYRPTKMRQPTDDGLWHQLTYAYDRINEEARLFYDGENVAVYSLAGYVPTFKNEPLRLGVSGFANYAQMELFNGRLDDLMMWSRPLSNEEVAQVYYMKTGRRVAPPVELEEQLTVMTWNVWHGGIHEGKYVGVKRIADVISDSGADVVMLQDVAESGERIADLLGFNYYHRSNNLAVMSRFPVEQIINIYKPMNAGCLKLGLGEGRSLIACPVWLSQWPNIEPYIKSGEAEVDSIVAREMETRDKEIRFILSEMRHLNNDKNIPVIMGGGFNTGSHLDWTNKTAKNNFGLVVPYPVTIQLANAGFEDAFRTKFPDELTYPGYTWSPKFSSALKNRTDFVFYNSDRLQLVDSYVIDDHAVGFPSDHGAVVAVFRWQK